MTLAKGVRAVIVGRAVIAASAHLLLPAIIPHPRQLPGSAQKKVDALVGAAAGVAAAIGPLVGGFIMMYLSWRVGFALES